MRDVFDGIKGQLTQVVFVRQVQKGALPDGRVKSVCVKGIGVVQEIEVLGRVLARFPNVIDVEIAWFVAPVIPTCAALERKFGSEREKRQLERLVLPGFSGCNEELVKLLLEGIDPSRLRVLDARECDLFQGDCSRLFANIGKANNLRELYLRLGSEQAEEYLRSLPPQVENLYLVDPIQKRMWDLVLERLGSHPIHTVHLNLRGELGREQATATALGPHLARMRDVAFYLDDDASISEDLAQRLGRSLCLQKFKVCTVIFSVTSHHFLTHLRNVPSLRGSTYWASMPHLSNWKVQHWRTVDLIHRYPSSVKLGVYEIEWDTIARQLLTWRSQLNYLPVQRAILRKYALERGITSAELEALSEQYPHFSQYVDKLGALIATRAKK
jgi:hypothetical protein